MTWNINNKLKIIHQQKKKKSPIFESKIIKVPGSVNFGTDLALYSTF